MAKPRKANGLRSVAVSVNQVVRPICRKRGLADAGLVNDWPTIVGRELAGQSQPQRLVRKRGADGGTLHILVAGPLALELQHLAPQVIERINSYFGYRAVERLSLHQGPIKRPTKPEKPSRTRTAGAAGVGGANRIRRGPPTSSERYWASAVQCLRRPAKRARSRHGNKCGISTSPALLPTFLFRNRLHRRLPPGNAGTYSTTCCGKEAKLRTTPLIMGLVALLFASTASAQSVDAGLALSERVLGDPAAPVEIVAYESLTCPHCAAFHAETYDALKERYIDTGKVRFVYRDFPLDGTALRASMLARCTAPEQYFGMLEILFRSQQNWARSHDAVGALSQIGRMAGCE